MTNQSLDTGTTATDAPFWSRFLGEYKRRVLHPITLIACICCSMLFAFIGPYNTYATDPLLFRIVFWSGVVVSSAIISLFFGVWANMRFEHKPFWFHSAIGGGAFSVVYFVFMWNVLRSVFGAEAIPHPAELFLVIVSISGLVYACMWFFAVMVEARIAELTGTPSEPAKPAPQNRPAIQHPNQFWEDYKTTFFAPANIGICLIGAAIFAAIGPFGAFQSDPYISRLAFWSALVWITSMFTLAFAVWANQRFTSHPFWFQTALGSTVFSVIYLVLIWITLRAIFPPGAMPDRIDFSIITIITTCSLYVALWFFAFIIESRVFAHTDIPAIQDPAPAVLSEHTENVCSVSQFLKRIGPDSGTRLIRLAMSDHYIEAHTDTGMHLLYMRFTDAIKALDTANGTQVHRSHWINLDEVDRPAKDGSNLTFVMSDGATVPVSRSRKKTLQQRGLI